MYICIYVALATFVLFYKATKKEALANTDDNWYKFPNFNHICRVSLKICCFVLIDNFFLIIILRNVFYFIMRKKSQVADSNVSEIL